ncbi:hypothetical protein D0C36_06990 [Mucilaginibacter conchicola]|uniref:Lipocalin-like domain-containing protein n=1 Tax=Mucilaginibacter conchicola TaxID=2303333 RepID=A0A372P0L2_9SPHI|nr:hypothetical protein [Mucilaginibacter conchicola]RFZ95267.1 hypothetical protein D0C36_06990 [Mucilaginibacter conchicola]
MKSKALLLILFISTALFSCKKDKADSVSTVRKEIVGKWQIQSLTYVGYDASGKEVERETQNGDDSNTIEFLIDNTVRTSSSDGSSPYAISEVNGKAQVQYQNQTYNVKITSGTMVWTVEQTGENQAYAKIVLTIQFKKV